MGEAPELLPCPFCGGQPEIWKASVDLGLPAWIACIHCKEGVFCTKEHSTTEAAIAAWNTRAPDPRVTALVEAAKAIGVREMVAGWNGENLETPYTPHPPHLWAKISTTCGAVYALDAALAAFKGGADG